MKRIRKITGRNMSKRILIKPLNNLIVRNPFTRKIVAPAGEETLDHTYWRRLEKQGDISIAKVEVAKADNVKNTTQAEAKK